MRKPLKQSGFAFLELVLVIVIIGAIVVIGLWVYQKRQPGTETTAGTTPSSSTQSPVAKNVSSAPQISSTDDLDKALTTLNQNDPAAANSGDQSQLDSQTSF
jgi:Tfp pilus assembly major pilin PilA